MPDLTLWLVPFILLCVWIQIVFQVRRGIRKGKLDFALRRSSEATDNTTRTVDRRASRFDFDTLFAFYCLCLVVIPLIIAIAVYRNLTGDA